MQLRLSSQPRRPPAVELTADCATRRLQWNAQRSSRLATQQDSSIGALIASSAQASLLRDRVPAQVQRGANNDSDISPSALIGHSQHSYGIQQSSHRSSEPPEQFQGHVVPHSSRSRPMTTSHVNKELDISREPPRSSIRSLHVEQRTSPSASWSMDCGIGVIGNVLAGTMKNVLPLMTPPFLSLGKGIESAFDFLSSTPARDAPPGTYNVRENTSSF